MYWWHHGFHEPETDVKLEWPLLRRVFSYFIPYWPLALVVLACIGLAAALGLVPALVTQNLINYLTGRHGQFGFVALLIGLLVGSSLLGGLIGVVQSYFSNRISQSTAGPAVPSTPISMKNQRPIIDCRMLRARS